VSIEVNDIAGYSSNGHNYSDLCLVWFCLKCNKVTLVNPIMLSISLGVVHYVTCVSDQVFGTPCANWNLNKFYLMQISVYL